MSAEIPTPVRLSAGDPAPPFRLPDADETPVSLADFAGSRLVVYFYPAASTPGCTRQAGDFRDNLARLAALGYQLVGISPDTPAKLRSFRAAEALNFPLLADQDHAVSEAYGAWGPKSSYGRPSIGLLRSTFAIDEAGRISWARYGVKATGHVTRLLEQLGG